MSQNSSKGKILFIPMCTQGHINYCVPIANRFLELYGDNQNGCEVHFALDEEYKNKVQKLCPKAKFVVYENPLEKKMDSHWLIGMMQKFGETWSDDLVSYVHKCAPVLKMNFQSLKALYPVLTQIVEDIKPDFIIFDQLFSLPVGKDKGYKWGNLFSAAINYVAHPCMPPPQSGLPTQFTPENVALWEQFIEKTYKTGPWLELKNEVSEHLKEKGLEGLDDSYFVYQFSPYLNIYGYPKELDFQEEEGRKLPGNWVRIETPVTKPFPDPFPVPEKLKNLPGKLIYFSLGSMAAVYKPLMQKILDVLEQLPHRFIISTGLIGDEYVMKENMYGEKYLPQFAVLQTVDLVISHGGNNTLTETFNFGKPIVFVPLFGDQPDNAQRMQDVGLGKRCNVFGPSDKLKQELKDAIEYSTSESVILRMKKASERIQKDSGLDRACEELFKLVKK